MREQELVQCSPDLHLVLGLESDPLSVYKILQDVMLIDIGTENQV